VVEVRLMSGIVADSPGLQRAAGLGIDTSADGIESVLERFRPVGGSVVYRLESLSS